MSKAKVLFHEEQSFRQIWFWLIIACAMLAGPIAVLVEFFSLLGKEVDPAKWSELYWNAGILIVLDGAVLFWILSMKLITTVTESGLILFYRGLYWKDIPISLDDVDSIGAVEYSPLFRYGGYGIRYVVNGKAYNVSGNQGVRINYKNGKHILIGSQEPKKLLKALQQIQP
ncbi:hypothetical protein K8I31_00235 [bacterium]|nr:hypothetical protein [bacterium]